VRGGAARFLRRRVRRLQHQDGLRDEEQGGGVEELGQRGLERLVGRDGGLGLGTGCAEKRIRSEEKMAAHTVGVIWTRVSGGRESGRANLRSRFLLGR
jgi:hypothetical protein